MNRLRKLSTTSHATLRGHEGTLQFKRKRGEPASASIESGKRLERLAKIFFAEERDPLARPGVARGRGVRPTIYSHFGGGRGGGFALEAGHAALAEQRAA